LIEKNNRPPIPPAARERLFSRAGPAILNANDIYLP